MNVKLYWTTAKNPKVLERIPEKDQTHVQVSRHHDHTIAELKFKGFSSIKNFLFSILVFTFNISRIFLKTLELFTPVYSFDFFQKTFFQNLSCLKVVQRIYKCVFSIGVYGMSLTWTKPYCIIKWKCRKSRVKPWSQLAHSCRSLTRFL